MLKRCILFVLYVFVFNVSALTDEKPRVLLISFDGFRYNYLDRTETPNFDALIHGGVKAKWIKDVFVSQTFPNHYSIATGLYEESHKIVANRFYDPDLNQSFSYINKKNVVDSRFWGGEPIWVTNQKQGGKTGVYFWVGSEAKIKNVRPTRWETFNKLVPWTDRVDTVVSWLANTEKEPLNINLALLYFSQPDHDGHKFGPESPEVTQRIAQCDNITGYLITKLKENKIYDEVNIIITSDHGMASLNKTKTVAIQPHLNMSEIAHYINYGTGAAIWPKKEFITKTYKSLLGINSHIKVWEKSKIPADFHYRHCNRIPPILLMPMDGWWLVDKLNDPLPLNGSHGYNNSLMDMHPFFIAHGPAFRKNYISEPFSSVDIYGLICKIMGLVPAPNNGTMTDVMPLLAIQTKSVDKYVLAEIIGITVGVVLAISVLVFLLMQYHNGRSRKQMGPPYDRSEPLLANELT